MALAEGVKNDIRLKGLIDDMGMGYDITIVFCGSQSTIHLAKNQVFHERIKHIDVMHHFV